MDELSSYTIAQNDNALSNAEQIAKDVSTEIQEIETESVFTEHAHEPFYKEGEFWVGFAFILVVVFLFKPVGSMLKAMLIKRRNGIIEQINQAEKLRDDAQVLLAQYEKKFLNAKDEADEILTKSESEIELLKNQTLNGLENELNAKRREVENSIEAATEKARKEINTLIGAQTINLVKEKILQNVNSKQHSKLIDNSVDNILKRLKSQK